MPSICQGLCAPWVFVAILTLAPCTTQALSPGMISSFYGGTSAGVVAAAQAARLNKTVVLAAPDTRLGGLASEF